MQERGGGPWFADDASIIEAVHASLHQLGLGVFSPSFWSDEKECVAAMVAGCGCLIPSSPCLPFALIGLRPSSFFFLLPDSCLFCPPFRCSSCPPVRVQFQEIFLVTTCRLQLLPDFSLSPSLLSVLIWRGGKEKEHAIFQVSSPSRILRLATAFRQAAVDRLEKRNNKNLAWQHLMLRWTTWWEWDQTCLGLGGWLPFRFLLTGGTRYSGKLPCKPPTLF